MSSRSSFRLVCAVAALAIFAAATTTCNGDGSPVTVPTSGTLEVTIATSGSDLDPDGYTVQLDAAPPQTIAASGTLRATDLAPGNHTVRLGDVASNCTVSGENPRAVSIAAGATTALAFTVTCGNQPGPPATLTLSRQPSPTATTGEPFPIQPVVEVRDQSQNLLDGVQVVASIESGGGTLGGTLQIPTHAGIATFTDLSIAGLAGSRTLGFRAGSASAVSDPVSVTLSRQAELGEWTPPFDWPVVGVHLHLLPTGQVLTWGLQRTPQVWDPATGLFTEALSTTRLVCSGHAFQADGRLLVTGGHIDHDRGLPDVNLFDPATRAFTRVASMGNGRWYPTTTTLATGEMVTVGGADATTAMVPIPEVWNGTGWRPLLGANLVLPYYPWMFQAPNGKVFYAGWSKMTRYLDVGGAGSWVDVALSTYGDREAGTAVMYQPGKVLIVGGGGGRLTPTPPTATAETIDLTSDSPAWQNTSPMAFARRHLNATLLPTGDVLVVGGTNGLGFNNAAGTVHEAEIWSPTTGSWKTLAPNTINRIYHSAAILLPDGRVLVTGAGENFDAATNTRDVNQFNAELYSPPYLFRGGRPALANVSPTLAYGSVFTVTTPDAASISKVTLVRLGSVTHSFNQNQRFLSLSFQLSGGALSVTAPASGNLAPPGDYLLFLVNGDGLPSVARFVSLH